MLSSVYCNSVEFKCVSITGKNYWSTKPPAKFLLNRIGSNEPCNPKLYNLPMPMWVGVFAMFECRYSIGMASIESN